MDKTPESRAPQTNGFRKQGRRDMRFMVMVKATAESEAGVMPSEELLAALGRFN
jgi:hypothetical protein